MSKNEKSLKEIIAEAKKEASIKNTPAKTEKNDPPSPIIKKELSDESLVKSIDDYDKNEWVNLRTSYANKLYWLLVGEIVGLFVLIVCIGQEILKISDTTLEVTIIAVLLQTFLLVREIVTNLFKKNTE